MKGLLTTLLQHERALRKKGFAFIAGVDEAGRGPLAGPVVAAAVVFPYGTAIEGINDSKKLSAGERERLYVEIMRRAVAVGTGKVESAEIDQMNILKATFLAMDGAIAGLKIKPDYLLVDGNMFSPGDASRGIPWETRIRGDGSDFSIAAASIVAKVTRDRLMKEFDTVYPGFGFARNKGYGTREHLEALARLGPCPIHRRSFSRVGAECATRGFIAEVGSGEESASGGEGRGIDRLSLSGTLRLPDP
jgi:ribonuclease HII